MQIICVFLGTFFGILASRNVNCENTCNDQEIIPRLTKIEALITDLVEKVDSTQNAINRNNLDHWIGNQSTFGNFKRLPNSAKRNLKLFHLENTEDLEISRLITLLRPCVNLQILRLQNVELIGRLPNTTETKLYLPQLHEFQATLSNYPNLGFRKLLEGILFFKKRELSSLDLDKLVEYGINIFISVADWKKIRINHEYGEFVFDAIMDDYGVLPKMLKVINASTTFDLKQLTITSGRIESDLLPPDLSYLYLSNVYLDHYSDQIGAYIELIKQNTVIKQLHLLPPRNLRDDHPGFDLDIISNTVKRLSLSNIRINSTKSKLFELEEVLLANCQFDNSTIRNFGRLFHQAQKVGIIHYFLSSSAYHCHPILNSLLMANNPKLKWIFIGACTRGFGSGNLPDEYERIEKILSAAGVGKENTDFLLEKIDIDGNWIGKNITEVDKKKIIYNMRGIEKLQTWEKYMQ